jgi:hypothetical protein
MPGVVPVRSIFCALNKAYVFLARLPYAPAAHCRHPFAGGKEKKRQAAG